MTWKEIYQNYIFKLCSLDLSESIIIDDIILRPSLSTFMSSKIRGKLSRDGFLQKCKVIDGEIVFDGKIITEHVWFSFGIINSKNDHKFLCYRIDPENLIRRLKKVDFFTKANRKIKIDNFLEI